MSIGIVLAVVSIGLVATAAGAVDAVTGASSSAVPRATAPVPATFAELLAGFRKLSGVEARFEEEKTLALLAAPLTSRGRLYFDPPATLLRRVDAPNPHDILVRNHVVRISTPVDVEAPGAPKGSAAGVRAVETIDLTHRDDVRPLVESLIWIFSGDIERIESVYEVEYRISTPDGDASWHLRLVPRAEPLSRLIQSISISGHGQGVDRLEVVEVSGDRTMTRIVGADTERRFAPGEIDRLFEAVRP